MRKKLVIKSQLSIVHSENQRTTNNRQPTTNKLTCFKMTIKDLGAQVETVWQNLRPATKKILFGAMDKNLPKKPNRKTIYDARADWELSRLLTTLDEQSGAEEIAKDTKKTARNKKFRRRLRQSFGNADDFGGSFYSTYQTRTRPQRLR